MKKSDILTLLAADEIRPALDLLSAGAKLLDNNDLQQELVLLYSQYENLQRDKRANTIGQDELRRTRNQLKQALISLTSDAFPDEIPTGPPTAEAAPAKQSGLSETAFKRQIFFFMLATKIAVIGWVLFHKSSGGFTSGEALATISLLLPAFTAYTSIMLGDFLKKRHRPALPGTLEPSVGSTVRLAAWVVFPVYLLALLWIIGAKAEGSLADEPQANYENMTAWLAIIESAFGVYVGQIVHAVFKGE